MKPYFIVILVLAANVSLIHADDKPFEMVNSMWNEPETNSSR